MAICLFVMGICQIPTFYFNIIDGEFETDITV
jgi:hypothetical protein